MFLDQVLPLIQQKFPVKEKKESAQLFFCLVHESLIDPHLRKLSERFPAVEAGIYPAHGTLSVALHSSDKKQLETFEKELAAQFSNYLYVSKSGKIEEAVQDWFVKHNKTLAFAESCTGGMISSAITSVPGASVYFLGSFVVYSNAMKEKILGVSKKNARLSWRRQRRGRSRNARGCFSKERRRLCDCGLRHRRPFPAEQNQNLPGTICAAIGERGKSPDVATFQAFGSRQTITLSASQKLLGALWRKVEKGIPAFPLLP